MSEGTKGGCHRITHFWCKFLDCKKAAGVKVLHYINSDPRLARVNIGAHNIGLFSGTGTGSIIII